MEYLERLYVYGCGVLRERDEMGPRPKNFRTNAVMRPYSGTVLRHARPAIEPVGRSNQAASATIRAAQSRSDATSENSPRSDATKEHSIRQQTTNAGVTHRH